MLPSSFMRWSVSDFFTLHWDTFFVKNQRFCIKIPSSLPCLVRLFSDGNGYFILMTVKFQDGIGVQCLLDKGRIRGVSLSKTCPRQMYNCIFIIKTKADGF